MCGIAGVMEDRRAVEYTRSMIEVQSHRGPDARGFFADPSGTVALGHCPPGDPRPERRRRPADDVGRRPLDARFSTAKSSTTLSCGRNWAARSTPAPTRKFCSAPVPNGA